MNKSIWGVLAAVFIAGCSTGAPADRWNIYGFFDPDQGVRINDFYDDYDPATMSYRYEDLFWFRSNVEGGNVSADEFLEAEAVYLGYTQDGIEFCTPGDLEGLQGIFKPARSVVMRVSSIQNFTRGLEKYTVLKIKYRYFYRPVNVPRGKDPSSIDNRRVSQAKKLGLMGINEFFLDEYEIIGKFNTTQSQIIGGLQRAGGAILSVARGTGRVIGRLLKIDDIISDGAITLENGNTYLKVGLGEMVKKATDYDGSDLYLTSRVKLVEDKGNNVWAFREADGLLVQTMQYSGHVPSGTRDLRIYYRFLSGGIFEVDEVKGATIFNDQW